MEFNVDEYVVDRNFTELYQTNYVWLSSQNGTWLNLVILWSLHDKTVVVYLTNEIIVGLGRTFLVHVI